MSEKVKKESIPMDPPTSNSILSRNSSYPYHLLGIRILLGLEK